MLSQLWFGDVNVTDYIVDGSYKFNSEAIYESWQNANYVEYRVNIAEKIKGECEIVCGPLRNAIPWRTLLHAIADATDVNGVTQVECWVPNKYDTVAIDAYVKVECVKHDIPGDGTWVDVAKITVTER